MRLLLSITVFLLLFAPMSGVAADVAGSKDHPLISRYPGSEIQYYDEQQFDEYLLPLGALGKDLGTYTKQQRLEGRVTRIHYMVKGNLSSVEVFRNYKLAIADAGFEILLESRAEGGANDAAGPNWTTKTYNQSLPGAIAGSLGNFGHRDRRRFLAAKLSDPGGDVYVAVMATQRSDDEVRVQLDIIEEEALKSGLIKVDADYLRNELERTGHVALYGIYFDVDKADVKPESEPALKVIAEVISADSKLNLYVVGHTDMTGGFQHNMDLSRDRARSVVYALTKEHGIAAERLAGYGVGPLCPVASNATNEGLAKNRRVELVAR